MRLQREAAHLARWLPSYRGDETRLAVALADGGSGDAPNHSGAVPSGVRLICSSSETGDDANPSAMCGYFFDCVGMLWGRRQRQRRPERGARLPVALPVTAELKFEKVNSRPRQSKRATHQASNVKTVERTTRRLQVLVERVHDLLQLAVSP